MKIRNLLMSVCAATLLVCSNSAHAEDSGNVYYAGSFKCSNNEYATNWNISKGLAGEVATTIYYQQIGSTQVEWLDLTERRDTSGSHLYDANGNPRLRLVADGEMIRATWLPGAPDYECSSFAVRSSKSPKERFDELFALMETPEPGDEVAAKVADIMHLPPIIYALPELDRQSYMQRLGELEGPFWTRYREVLAKDIASRPLATDPNRKAFAERVSSALSNAIRFTLRRDGFEATLTMLQQAADRYAANGGTPSEELYVGKELVCQRLRGILKADPYFNFAKLELAAGVPADYWTRPLAEDLLSSLRACDDVIEDYARQLMSKWPEIQEKQKLVVSLLQEQARLLALPVSIETLVETKNLQPDDALLQSISRRSTDYQRFFGAPLDIRREELLNISLASITERATDYSIDKSEMATAVSEACEVLNDLSEMDDDKRDKVRQTCEAANEKIAEKQAEQAVAQVNTAFSNAEPDSAAAEAADKLCDSLPSTLSNGAASKVYEACSDARKVMTEKKEALKCEQAVTSAGASSELLATTVSVRESSGSSKAAVKDLICNATKMGAQLSFATSGYLAWKTQSMDMKMERAREGEELLHFVLSPAEDADWVVTTEDENTVAILAKQGVKVEIVTACIMRTAACHP